MSKIWVNKCFDTFIYTGSIIDAMEHKEAVLRAGGALLAVGGVLMILISGELGVGFGIEMNGELAGFLLRAGFGILLVGILILFLFSVRTVPQELTDPFLLVQGKNLARMIEGMNLEGKGVYIPKGGRLLDDRVYVPMEKKALPLPHLSSDQVFNVGTTSSSMGISIIPPGKDLVDKVEKDSGKELRNFPLHDATETLEILGKGTGLFKAITVRTKGDRVIVQISHSRLKHVCERLWEDHPDLHERVGCPACSAVLTGVARIAKSPCRIESVKRSSGVVEYELKRGVD